MKKSFYLSFLAIAVFIFCGQCQIGYAEERIGATCSNGVEWQYENGVFTLSGFEELSEKVDENVMYGLGIYDDEQLLDYNVRYDKSFNDVQLSVDVDELQKYKLKLLFWKDNLEPICEAEAYDILKEEPTCKSSGYQSIYNYATDTKSIFNATAPLGHDYGESIIIKNAGIVECRYKSDICTRCGNIEEGPYYLDTGVARLCMYGDLTGIGKKSEVPITVSFEGEGKCFENYALLKYQGHTSLIYEKKNFTLKLFEDEDKTKKNKIVFRDWKKEHKYILKANYVDPSVCRNLICANIWSEMVSCRAGHSPRLDKCSNYGATDGFPVALYLNDKFLGLYTMTLHRDDDLFDMDDDVKDAIAVTNTNHYDESRFKAQATFAENSDWEVEFDGMEEEGLVGEAWVEDKVNDLIEFVRTSSGEEFKSNLCAYMDVNSAIDYLIAIYSFGLTENGSKNMTFATYSDGPWIMSLCDMETAFGIFADGTGYYAPDYFLPVYSEGVWNSSTNSLLWDRLLNNFEAEIKSRYKELRSSVLASEKIINAVSAFIETIPAEFYEADMNLYPKMPQLDVSAKEQIKTYVVTRFALLDDIFMQ